MDLKEMTLDLRWEVDMAIGVVVEDTILGKVLNNTGEDLGVHSREYLARLVLN